jgi:hypothetical protein
VLSPRQLAQPQSIPPFPLSFFAEEEGFAVTCTVEYVYLKGQYHKIFCFRYFPKSSSHKPPALGGLVEEFGGIMGVSSAEYCWIPIKQDV